jgi:hypothetical protein
MFAHRNADEEFLKEKKELFEETITAVREKILFQDTPPRLPVTVLEALLVGIAKNLKHVESEPRNVVENMYAKFRADSSFSDAALAEGLSKKDKVQDRLKAAKMAFSE